MFLSPDVAQRIGIANILTGNNLSSVEFDHNTKGDTWDVKVYHEDAMKAYEVADIIEKKCREEQE